jgi:glycosyltransferase involved in cell wall biosynthesis
MNLNLKCPINSLGYGVTGVNILKALMQKDINVAHFPIGMTTPETREDAMYVQIATNNQQSFDYYAPCLKIWHQFDMAEWIGKNKLYGMPIFELDTLKPNEIHHLEYCDEIIVSSQWAQRIINKYTTKPCGVVPLGVNRLIFHEDANKASNKCVLFNCGKWEIRKGHDILGEVFLETFKDADDVELWMMCDNPFFTAEETREWEVLYSDPKIRLIHRVKTQSELAEVMRYTTCGVFPSRAEGWNLELLEMMSCGKQVIATNYSGHTEFCNQDNCYLIDIDDIEPAYDGKWFFGTGNWASLGSKQKEQLSRHMRSIYDGWKNRPENLVNRLGIETAKFFSWEHAVAKILTIIKEVQ